MFGFNNWDYSSNIFQEWKWTSDFPNLLAIRTNMTEGKTYTISAEWAASPIKYSGFD